MTKYTASDFANARFAERAGSGYAAHRESFGWVVGGNYRHSDKDMADAGWVPVPTRPTLTDSQVGEIVAAWESDDYLTGFIAGYQHAGGRIIDDPEPTNTERLVKLFEDYDTSPASMRQSIPEWLNDHGVTAPKEDGK